MAVLPDTPTAMPNLSFVAPSEAVSSAVWVACGVKAHPNSGFTNTYADPCFDWPTWWNGLPMTTVSPEIETAKPNRSEAAPSDAVSSAVSVMSVQPDVGSTNTYAAPWSAFGPICLCAALATSVSPEIETDEPRKSRVAPSEAVNSAVWVAFFQPEAGFTNTYAAPC